MAVALISASFWGIRREGRTLDVRRVGGYSEGRSITLTKQGRGGGKEGHAGAATSPPWGSLRRLADHLRSCKGSGDSGFGSNPIGNRFPTRQNRHAPLYFNY